MRRDKNKKKRGGKSGIQNKLSLFKKPDVRLKRSCPLSTKEAPQIDKSLVQQAEDKVLNLQSNISSLSEMAKIRNLHWWTVEYGLIGSINKK